MILPLKWILFLVGSLFLIYISRNSLRILRSHGFYRFFAWEFILLLFLINADYWFQSPFSWNQIIAWILLVGSADYVLEGFRLLRQKGANTDQRSEEHLYKVEKPVN